MVSTKAWYSHSGINGVDGVNAVDGIVGIDGVNGIDVTNGVQHLFHGHTHTRAQ